MRTAQAVRENYGAVEADWLRWYGRSLSADLYGPAPLGTRKVIALFEHLPPEAAVWRDIGVGWSTELELQAINIEVLDSLRRAFIIANSKKGTKQPEPLRIPRPYEKTGPARSSGTRLGEMLRAMKMPVKLDRGKKEV